MTGGIGMVIGAWGGIAFKVSENHTMLLSDLEESSSSNLAKHEIMAGRTKYEWINYGAGELSIKIVFDSMICRKPYNQYMKLKNLEGYTSPLMIGRKRIGYHSWMLQKVSGRFSRILPKGAISRIEVTCKFVEYYTGSGNSNA